LTRYSSISEAIRLKRSSSLSRFEGIHEFYASLIVSRRRRTTLNP
jgi:hypothetical protein